ncbi:2709_t:CDS:1 [Cetraspora pellucida]|uniref:2709_t:CDS:1 n=1 Tax=Cetraspora pellucida TaxID=1433469 RepID=A0ACA9M204_9GLOM|nr:2709_t:CDS:1 [Cetraspora pellucida]
MNNLMPIENDQDSLIDEVINDISNEASGIKNPISVLFMEIEEPKSQSTPVVLITNEDTLQFQSEKPDNGFTLILQRKRKDKKSKKDLANQKIETTRPASYKKSCNGAQNLQI